MLLVERMGGLIVLSGATQLSLPGECTVGKGALPGGWRLPLVMLCPLCQAVARSQQADTVVHQISMERFLAIESGPPSLPLPALGGGLMLLFFKHFQPLARMISKAHF